MFKKLTNKEKILKVIRKNSMTVEQIAAKLNDWPSMIEYDVKELFLEGKIEITAKFNGKPCFIAK